MADTTGISWCHRTASPWFGCQKVSPACDHCYAESWAKRSGMVQWGPGADRRRAVDYRGKLLKWNRQAAAAGERWRVFASLCDPFDNAVHIEWFVDYLDVLRLTPNLDHLVLTKRIGNWRSRVSEAMEHVDHTLGGASLGFGQYEWLEQWTRGNPPANVWLGATVVNQEEADRDIPKLLATPARVRFLSMEPLLSGVDLRTFVEHDPFRCPQCLHSFTCVDETVCPRLECPSCGHEPVLEGQGRVDWVIAGGESGPKARPSHPDWFRSLMQQCKAAGVAFHQKQITERGRPLPMEQWPEDLRIQEFPT